MKKIFCLFALVVAVVGLAPRTSHAEQGSRPIPVAREGAWLAQRGAAIRTAAPAALAKGRVDLKAMRARLERVFAGAGDALPRERAFKRLAIAEDTCAFVARNLAAGDDGSLQFVERGLEDIRLFLNYFEAEAELWPKNPINPAAKPCVINAADYGVTATHADAAAFDRAFAAARALRGRPCIVRVPAGRYLFGKVVVSPKWGHKTQLAVSCLTNVVIEGASPETTELVWGVYDGNGGTVENCENVTLRNFQIRWEKNPFTEGPITDVNVAEGWCDMRPNPRAKRPDDPCFKGALSCEFSPEGQIDFPSSFAWLDTERPVRKLENGLYRLFFNRTRFGDSYTKIRKGYTICIPDRDNALHAFRILGGRFVTFDSLWFRNSRAAAFSTYLTQQSSATHCRVFPMAGCVLSLCADGYYAQSGSYFAHSDFTRMHDDANNSHTYGRYLYGQIGDDTLVFKNVHGAPKKGDLMLLVSPLTGEYIGNVRVRENAVATNFNGEAGLVATRFESLPPGLCTYASLDMRAITAKEQTEIIFGRQKVKRMPDHIYTPGQGGVASVVTDCRLSSMRNCALPVQAPNELIESNVIENVSCAISMTAATQWMEGPPPYHVVVRHNVFRGCGTTLSTMFRMPNHGPAKNAPIRDCRIEGNVIEDSHDAAISLVNASDASIVSNRITGGSAPFSCRVSEKVRLVGNMWNGKPVKDETLDVR